MFKTIHRGLTKDQKDRGVIYSTQLIVLNNSSVDNDTIHEVLSTEANRAEKIRLLKDVSFFKNMANDMNWDVVNIVRQ